ncbi:hypothetical protein VSVS12_00141 [Vibrio scophthalmi]|uniref:hypothetical protein n=1 Tax=Vibrio scophthalmi TaxID=45658 RepID=UPI0008097CB9|nr:hypothetical protein [Vibrio scophthalmi]ANS83977.1 hypothetical protein VSVS12_00141 [Vibrio scophthalmi]
MLVNKSYVAPQFGESLHSFMLRVLLRTGHGDLSGVLSKTGGWVRRPEIPYEIKDEFSSFKKTDLLSLYESYVMVFNSTRLFDNPFKHLYEENRGANPLVTSYKNVFHPNYNKNCQKSSFPIRYCGECIQYQIWKYGFGYFKAEWYDGKQCLVHSVDLSLGIMPLNETPYGYIQKILQGRTINYHRSREDESKVKLRAIEDAKFAPCLQRELVTFLNFQLRSFPSGYAEILDYNFLYAHERLAISKLSFRNQLHVSPEVFFEALIEKDYEIALSFLSDKVETTVIQHVDEILVSNKRLLLKSKNSDCSRCSIPKGIKNEKFCPASNLIFITYQNQGGLIFNVTDKSLNELKNKVHQYQDSLGVRDGETRVKKNLRQSEMYAQFGGKDAYHLHMKKKKEEMLKLKLWSPSY